MFTLVLTRAHRPYSGAPAEAAPLGLLGCVSLFCVGQSALWREKLEVQGTCGPATAVF